MTTNQRRAGVRGVGVTGLGVVVSVAALLASAGAAQAPQEMKLTPARVVLRDGAGSIFKAVATAQHGETVKVLQRDPNNWLQLERDPKSGGEKGWAHAKALELRADPDGGNLAKALSTRNDAPQVRATAASKGIEPQTEIYASYRGISTAGLAELKRRRESIAREDYLRFIQDLKKGG